MLMSGVIGNAVQKYVKVKYDFTNRKERKNKQQE